MPLILLLSCERLSKKDHLPSKVMAKVLTDINIAEAYSTEVKDSLHRAPNTKNIDSLARYYKDIFAHYNITAGQFTASMKWYESHPQEMDSLYQNVITSLPVLDSMSKKKME